MMMNWPPGISTFSLKVELMVAAGRPAARWIGTVSSVAIWLARAAFSVGLV